MPAHFYWNEEEWYEFFLDMGGRGYDWINRGEFNTLVRSLDPEVSQVDLNEAWDEGDQDGNGQLWWDEFWRLVQQAMDSSAEGSDNFCAMNQRARIDGSCKTCKKPYIQSDDGMDCVFVGYRTYDADSYMGRLVNYKQYGKGIYQWSQSGNSYYGLWLDGQKHGEGIKMWRSGTNYIGGWRNDTMDGRGTYTFRSGKFYDGEMKNGMFHGQGFFMWPDGTMIDGEFRNDEPNGYATKYWTNGAMYEGEWVDGFEYGWGSYTSDYGRYEGNWVWGNKEGYGTFWDNDGNVYEGEWYQDQFVGY